MAIGEYTQWKRGCGSLCLDKLYAGMGGREDLLRGTWLWNRYRFFCRLRGCATLVAAMAAAAQAAQRQRGSIESEIQWRQSNLCCSFAGRPDTAYDCRAIANLVHARKWVSKWRVALIS